MIKLRITQIIIGIGCFIGGNFWSLQATKVHKSSISAKKIVYKKTIVKKNNTNITKKSSNNATKTIKLDQIALTKVPFNQLPAWDKTDVSKSLLAFQTSCKSILKQNPSNSAGSQHIKIKAKDWQPACEAALTIDTTYEAAAKDFFEKWFYPVEFVNKRPVQGTFTGYYMPQLNGSLVQTSKYNTPIYGLPQNLKWKNSTHVTREQIDKGVLQKKAPVIAWVDSPVERLFLEIEGSGIVKLANGKRIYLNYAGENGSPYTSIGSFLIKKGVMNKHSASRENIKNYLESHPQNMNSILHQNKSFVFFETINESKALGARGMYLTPGYSLAIDRKWIPLGAPLWLTTKIPDKKTEKNFQRLMIAQDTGGSIKGMMRGDIFWGSSKRAAFLGENMKNEGKYWLLLPKPTFKRLAIKV